MATTGNSDASSTTAETTETTSQSAQQQQQQPLPLPAPPSDSKATELNVSTGEGVRLDHLGPMVVNRDGTLSRIGNWEQMSDIERRNTLRVLGKRNQLRMETLRAQEDGDAASK